MKSIGLRHPTPLYSFDSLEPQLRQKTNENQRSKRSSFLVTIYQLKSRDNEPSDVDLPFSSSSPSASSSGAFSVTASKPHEHITNKRKKKSRRGLLVLDHCEKTISIVDTLNGVIASTDSAYDVYEIERGADATTMLRITYTGQIPPQVSQDSNEASKYEASKYEMGFVFLCVSLSEHENFWSRM